MYLESEREKEWEEDHSSVSIPILLPHSLLLSLVLTNITVELIHPFSFLSLSLILPHPLLNWLEQQTRKIMMSTNRMERGKEKEKTICLPVSVFRFKGLFSLSLSYSFCYSQFSPSCCCGTCCICSNLYPLSGKGNGETGKEGELNEQWWEKEERRAPGTELIVGKELICYQ